MSEYDLDSNANKTNTSLADSSVYNLLADDLQAAHDFIERSKEEKEALDNLGKSHNATQLVGLSTKDVTE